MQTDFETKAHAILSDPSLPSMKKDELYLMVKSCLDEEEGGEASNVKKFAKKEREKQGEMMLLNKACDTMNRKARKFISDVFSGDIIPMAGDLDCFRLRIKVADIDPATQEESLTTFMIKTSRVSLVDLQGIEKDIDDNYEKVALKRDEYKSFLNTVGPLMAHGMNLGGAMSQLGLFAQELNAS